MKNNRTKITAETKRNRLRRKVTEETKQNKEEEERVEMLNSGENKRNNKRKRVLLENNFIK